MHWKVCMMRARSGLSVFLILVQNVWQILQLLIGLLPAVNQVETHLFWQQYNLHEWMVKYNIQHEAWGPLAQHRLKEVLENPVVKQIADAHGKTPAQVALRQHIQRGIVVIPKSVHKERMKQNMDIFDF